MVDYFIMKAAQYSKYGGPEVIEIRDVPKLSPSENQVLVEIHAASVNPIDWKIRNGMLGDRGPIKFPVTIGGNFSGVVVEAGSKISEFKVGDEVYGQALVLNGGSGSYAEFSTSNQENTARKPSNINHIEAASLPLVGISALQGLEQHINLQKGQKILIHGGAGGIGTIAIQIAKHIGARVATTVSTKDVEYVKKLGADEVIDYKSERFEEKLRDFDAVFEASGKDIIEPSFKVLKKGGIFVTMTAPPDQELAKKYGVRAMRESTDTTTPNFNRLTELVEAGVVKPQVDRVFKLEETRQAFEYKETGHPRGKVVIAVK